MSFKVYRTISRTLTDNVFDSDAQMGLDGFLPPVTEGVYEVVMDEGVNETFHMRAPLCGTCGKGGEHENR